MPGAMRPGSAGEVLRGELETEWPLPDQHLRRVNEVQRELIGMFGLGCRARRVRLQPHDPEELRAGLAA